jgi:RecB family exonuclease
LPAPVAAAETERLRTLICAWVDGFERARPAFVVRERELQTDLALGDLVFSLRIDRVDDLDEGGRVVIDYKSGHSPGVTRWFDARPAGTQLGLYALALLAAQPDATIRAVAYARLKAGEISVVGLAADAHAWPAVPDVARRKALPVASWAYVETFWRNEYGALAQAFRAGEAAVAPRSGDICGRCGMQALCRVRVRDDQDENDDDAD